MKTVQIVGLVWLFVIAVYLVHINLGWDHITQDEVPAIVIGGVCGGFAAWYWGRRQTGLGIDRRAG